MEGGELKRDSRSASLRGFNDLSQGNRMSFARPTEMTEEGGIKPLNLRFKGERTYLHGTDLFDAMCSETGARNGIRQMVNRPMLTPVAYVEMPGRKPDDLLATFAADGKLWAVVPSAGEVEGRYPYDEDAIAQRGMIFERSIYSYVETASLIETIVACNKALLNFVLGRRDWWFAGIEIDPLPENPTQIALTIAAESRLIRSSLEVDTRPVGSVYFHERR